MQEKANPKFKAVCYYYKRQHRVWEIEKDGQSWKTVVIDNRENRVCFVIDEQEHFAVIIDNGDWDLLCFDLDYSPDDVLVACMHYLNYVREDCGRVKAKGNGTDLIETYFFDEYIDLMTVVS